MPIHLDSKRKTNRVRLHGVIDINAAAELKTKLLTAVANGKDTLLELGAVIELDVTAIQLLLAAERAVQANGQALSISGQVPEGVSDALESAGFPRLLLAVPAE